MPMIQDDQPVADCFGQSELMRRNDNGPILVLAGGYKVLEVADCDRVERQGFA